MLLPSITICRKVSDASAEGAAANLSSSLSTAASHWPSSRTSVTLNRAVCPWVTVEHELELHVNGILLVSFSMSSAFLASSGSLSTIRMHGLYQYEMYLLCHSLIYQFSAVNFWQIIGSFHSAIFKRQQLDQLLDKYHYLLLSDAHPT